MKEIIERSFMKVGNVWTEADHKMLTEYFAHVDACMEGIRQITGGDKEAYNARARQGAEVAR